MSTTPNMGLPVPEPGGTPAPNWGQNQQDAMALLDRHRHVEGEGLRVPSAGINVNDPLDFQGYPSFNHDSVQLIARGSPPDWSPSTDSKRSVFSMVDGELYYKDGVGNIVKITNGGIVNGAGGGGAGISYFLTATNVATLRVVSPATIQPYQVYKTISYGSTFGRGGAFYLWDPTEAGVDDGALIIRPFGASVGAFVYMPADGETFDTHATPWDFTGQTDESQRFLDVVKGCQARGFRMLGWDGDLEVRTAQVLMGTSAYQGLTIEFEGRSVAKTRFRSRISYTRLVGEASYCATSAFACIASGFGATKTLTALANGAYQADGVDVVAGKTVLFTAQPSNVDNGWYTCTVTGDASHKATFVRNAAMNTDASIGARLGIRITEGSTRVRAIYVVSNKPDFYYDSSPMTMDVSPQYWTQESFVPGAIEFRPQWEVPVYRAARPSYSAQHINQAVSAGSFSFSPVNFLAGGSWTDPDTLISYNLKAVEQGDLWFVKLGGTPTDQGWYYDGYFTRVKYVDSSTSTVVVDKAAPLTTLPTRINLRLGQVTATGVNQFTVGGIYTQNVDLCEVGWRIIADGRTGIGIVATKNPSTGVVTVTPGTLPAGISATDNVWTIPVAPVNLGTLSAVGVNQVTLTTAGNAALVAPGDRLWVQGRANAIYDGTEPKFAIVTSSDSVTGIITLQVGTLAPGATIGDTAFQIVNFPSYNSNYARDNSHNEYHRCVQESVVRMSKFTFDSVTLNLDFSNVQIEDFEIRNVHIGLNVAGTTGNIRRGVIRNQNGYPFPGITSPSNPLSWYGWAWQSNYNPDLTVDLVHGDGISGDWADQEAETRTRWSNIRVTLAPCPVSHNAQFIGGTTPNVLKHNPVRGLIVDGAFDGTKYTVVLQDPVDGLTCNAVYWVNNTPGVVVDLSTLTGVLEYKGRRYDLGNRRHWSTWVPLTASMNKTITRPWQGLWSNTRFWFTMPTMTGLTSVVVAPTFSTSINLLSVIQGVYRQNAWIVPGTDTMSGNYPNLYDTDKQTLQFTTDGTFPAGTWAVYIESDCIPAINRGDGYNGVSTLADPLQYKIIPDIGDPPLSYGNGAPAVAPKWSGQKYVNSATGDIYMAIDVTGAGDWKKLT